MTDAAERAAWVHENVDADLQYRIQEAGLDEEVDTTLVNITARSDVSVPLQMIEQDSGQHCKQTSTYELTMRLVGHVWLLRCQRGMQPNVRTRRRSR